MAPKNVSQLGADTVECVVNHRRTLELSKYNIDLCGYSVARKGYHFIRDRSPYQLILACTDGVGEVMVNGNWEPCTANTAYLGPHDAPQAFRVRPGCEWAFTWILYGSPRSLEDEPLGNQRHASLIPCDPEPMALAMRGLYHASMHMDDPLFIGNWLKVLHLHAVQIAKGKYTDPRARNAWRQVQQNLAKDWTLDALAGLASMSGENFRRICHKELGASPMQFLKALRMQRAEEILVLSTSSIESICSAVGYTNQFSFSTAFKKYAGVSPSRYREQHQTRIGSRGREQAELPETRR